MGAQRGKRPNNLIKGLLIDEIVLAFCWECESHSFVSKFAHLAI